MDRASADDANIAARAPGQPRGGLRNDGTGVIDDERDETMTAERLSGDLRLGSSEFLRRRRRVLVLSLVSAGAMMPISLN